MFNRRVTCHLKSRNLIHIEDWFFASAFITNPEPEAAATEASSDSSQPETTAGEPETSTGDGFTFEQGVIRGLQEAILALMEKRGPVTEQMRRDVENNTHHDSLVTWVKSF